MSDREHDQAQEWIDRLPAVVRAELAETWVSLDGRRREAFELWLHERYAEGRRDAAEPHAGVPGYWP